LISDDVTDDTFPVQNVFLKRGNDSSR
jgi:hypothetical protein